MRILASTAAVFALAISSPPSPAFDRLKSPAGGWTGTAIGSGSAVMLTTDPGTPHDSVTVIRLKRVP